MSTNSRSFLLQLNDINDGNDNVYGNNDNDYGNNDNDYGNNDKSRSHNVLLYHRQVVISYQHI